MVSGLVSLLTCPVCTEVMAETPIMVCENEHFTCESCKRRMAHCPVCRGAWLGKSRTAEMLRSLVFHNVMFPCPNEKHGCGERRLHKQIPIHLAWCDYQQVACPAALTKACGWEGSMKDLFPHVRRSQCAYIVKESHKDSRMHMAKVGVPMPRTGRDLPGGCLNPPPRHIFLTNAVPAKTAVCLSIITGEKVMACLRIFGSLLPSFSSEGMVQILKPFEPQVAFSFSGLLHPWTRSVEAIQSSGNFLELSMLQVLVLHTPCKSLRIKTAFPLISGGKAPCCNAKVEQRIVAELVNLDDDDPSVQGELVSFV